MTDNMSGRNVKRHAKKGSSPTKMQVIRVAPLHQAEFASTDCVSNLQREKGEKTHPWTETRDSQEIRIPDALGGNEQNMEGDKTKTLLQDDAGACQANSESSLCRWRRQRWSGEACLMRILIGLAFILSVGNLFLTFMLFGQKENCVCQQRNSLQGNVLL